jgi:predicted exporter
MRRRFLERLAVFLFRRAWFMLPLLVVSLGVSIWTIDQRMQFDTSLIAFLPPSSAHEQKIRETVRDYRALEPVMVTIRSRKPGQEALLRNLAQVFADDWLDDQSYFHPPVYRTDELLASYYQSLPNLRLVQLLTPDDWEELKRLMAGRITRQLIENKAYRLNAFVPPEMKQRRKEDPLGALTGIRERLAHSRGPTRLETRDGYFISADGRSIAILLYPVLPPENARGADRTLRFLERSRVSLLDRFEGWREAVDIEFNGGMVETARNVREVRREFEVIAWFSVPATVLLLLLVFRKVEAILFVLLPPFVGVHWALALATWLFGGVTAVTAMFMAVVGAVGLQFSIQLYHRFTLELYRTKHYYRALRQSYVETARGLFTTALALALIFFFLFLTSLWGRYSLAEMVRVAGDTHGLGQLGLVVGLCILCNLAACLVTLPLLAAVKHAMARGKIVTVKLYRFKLDRLYEPAIRRPQATILAMLLVGVLCGFYSNKLQLYPRFASVSSFFYQEPRGIEASTGGFPRPGRPLIAVVDGVTLEEALAANDRLYGNLWTVGERYGVLAVDSLRTVLPSRLSQQASLAQLESLDLEAFRKEIERSSRRVGFGPQVYEPFLQALASFKEAASSPRYLAYTGSEQIELVSTVPRYATSKETADGKRAYYVRTAIYPSASGFDPGQFDAMRADLSEGLGNLVLIGDPVIENQLETTFKFNLAVMVLLSIGTILLALALHFRQRRLVWLTLAPIVVEMLWMGGVMALVDLEIHFFTVLAMPLVLSLALDNGTQLTQYHSDRQPCSVRYAMQSVGRVAALTCLTAALLYGTLGLMSYPGIRDFGLMVLIGVVAVMMGTTMLLPALLQVLGKGQPLSEALTVGGESEE